MNEKTTVQQGSERVGRAYRDNQMSDKSPEFLRHGRQLHDAAIAALFSRLGRGISRIFGSVKHQGREGVLPKRPRRHGWVG